MEDIFDPVPEPEIPTSESADALTPEVPNSELPQPRTESETPDTGYRGMGTGRKESPYADSPYEMPHRTQPRVSTERPVKSRKKASKRIWKRILAAAAAVVLVIGSCSVTALLVNASWEDRMGAMQESFDRQILDLKQQIGQLTQAAAGSRFKTPVSQDHSRKIPFPLCGISDELPIAEGFSRTQEDSV